MWGGMEGCRPGEATVRKVRVRRRGDELWYERVCVCVRRAVNLRRYMNGVQLGFKVKFV